jgi:hypothetical protein
MDLIEMNKRIPGLGAIVATALLLLVAPSFAFNCPSTCPTCDDPRPEDTLICGCTGPLEQGMVQCVSLAANVGESITLPVNIHTISEISAMGADITFPMEVLRYDSTSAGDLTADYDFFGASLHPSGNLVRIGGFEIGDDNIPPDTIGQLANIHFTVIAPGCGSFCIVTLFDDIASYDPCTSTTTGTPVPEGVETSTWGQVKSIYR